MNALHKFTYKYQNLRKPHIPPCDGKLQNEPNDYFANFLFFRKALNFKHTLLVNENSLGFKDRMVAHRLNGEMASTQGLGYTSIVRSTNGEPSQ